MVNFPSKRSTYQYICIAGTVYRCLLNFLFIILVVCIVVNYYIVFNEQNMTI